MTESTKTITFVGVAVLVLFLAWLNGPAAVVTSAETDTGPFFKSFKPEDATSMEIVHYDEANGASHQFKVAMVNEVWCIPSHENYPADAAQHLADAAATLDGLKKLGLATTDKSLHAQYGVVDPDPKTLKTGETGVGKLVTLADKSGKKLAEFIFGKEVKDQAGQHFVRLPGQDAVYRAKVQPEKLSTKFEDWIEKDLLKLNPNDVREVVLDNHSVDEARGVILKGDKLELKYESDGAKWSLAGDGMKVGEQLATDKLNELKTALGDLKIVDVRRKPDELTEGLREGGIQPNLQTARMLQQRGFYLVPVGPSQADLYSNEGEVVCKMRDGVEYVLRFGNIATGTQDAEQADPAAESVDESKGSGLNRYLFVQARFNGDMIPAIEKLPYPPEVEAAVKEAAGTAAPPAKEGSDCDPQEPLQKPADNAQPAAAGKPANQDPAAKPADDLDDAKDKAQQKKEAERKRREIDKQNETLQKEYDEKIKKGEERVKELNNRFAEWYYVISDGVYRKIHLDREDVVKSDFGVGQFNQIKQEGLKEAKPPE